MILPRLGALTIAAPAEYLITPQQSGQAAFEAFLNEATHEHRSMIYSATLPLFYDKLIEYKQQGIDTKTIFDHTEAATRTERAQFERLVAAGLEYGKDFLIGTSPKAHAILHIKATWIDQVLVWQGSWNYSKVADDEVNTIEIVQAPALAELMTQTFDTVWAWIAAHESFAGLA